MKSLCIYHGGCTDGVASAWVVWKALVASRAAPSECSFYPGVYQQDPPWSLIKQSRQVFFVDFSYKRSVMEEVCDCCSDVVVLDHHKTAKEDLEPLLLGGMVKGIFDMERCGALIAWDYFFDRPYPEMLIEIDKQDRWLSDGDAGLIMALRSHPHAPKNEDPASFTELMQLWDRLMSADGKRRLELDKEAILRYYRQRCKETEGHERFVALDGPGTELPVINAPFFMASDVANRLAAEYGGPAAVWWQNKDGSVTFSLRSRGGFDVSEIAVHFGGGGHKNAAGFKLSEGEAARILFSQETGGGKEEEKMKHDGSAALKLKPA